MAKLAIILCISFASNWDRSVRASWPNGRGSLGFSPFRAQHIHSSPQPLSRSQHTRPWTLQIFMPQLPDARRCCGGSPCDQCCTLHHSARCLPHRPLLSQHHRAVWPVSPRCPGGSFATLPLGDIQLLVASDNIVGVAEDEGDAVQHLLHSEVIRCVLDHDVERSFSMGIGLHVRQCRALFVS